MTNKILTGLESKLRAFVFSNQGLISLGRRVVRTYFVGLFPKPGKSTYICLKLGK